MPSAVVNGVRFHVQRRPAAPAAYTAARQAHAARHPVVFVHGMVWDDLSSFATTLAPAVCSGGREAVLYDLRGHGRSQRTPTGYRPEDAVADLFGILDQLRIRGPVHVVGRSYGGAVALAAALRAPARVASLVLIEPHAADPGWGKEIADFLIDVAVAVDDERLHAWLEATNDPKVRHGAQVAAELVDSTTILGDLAAAAPIGPDQLRTLACPVLAVYGEHSERATSGLALRAAIPRCRLEFLPGQDDAALEQATGTLSGLLPGWLDQAETAPPATGPQPSP